LRILPVVSLFPQCPALGRLRTELEERKSSIPIHSIRPHQLIEIEELEEEIEELKKKLDQS